MEVVPKMFLLSPLLLLLLLGVIGAVILVVMLSKKQPWVAAVVGIGLLLGLAFFFLMPAVSYHSVETAHGTQSVQAVGTRVALLPMLLIGALAIACVVALLVKVGRKQPWVAAIVGLALLGLPVLFVLFHFVRSGVRVEHVG